MSLSFSTALEALKAGKRVAREGWNGKGMWLALVTGDQSYEIFGLQNFQADQEVTFGDLKLLPWIGMKTADNGFVPWLASQTDILASDWCCLVDTLIEPD